MSALASPVHAASQVQATRSGVSAVHTSNHSANKRVIPGTPIFDGEQAMKGYALNAMCYSFNDKLNRNAYRADASAYCRKFSLNAEQTTAVLAMDVLALLRAGGNIYYLAKLTGIHHLNVQDIGAQQTGMSVEEFKAMLHKHQTS
jgi:protocatechuate 4,5-dioxygenase alpha chain